MIGKKILGKLNFTSPPYSNILKKALVLFFILASFEEPKLPRNEKSKISAPLNKFLNVIPVKPEIPNSWMLDCVKSALVLNSYFFNGVNTILAINPFPEASSTYWIRGYANTFKLDNALVVSVLSCSLNSFPSSIKIAFTNALGLYFSFPEL